MSEHIVRVLTGGRRAWGWCLTCAWEGPARGSSQLAGVDATRHAAELAPLDDGRGAGEG